VNVLVDTSIWSLALRRHNTVSKEVVELSQLIQESRVEMIGPIRQEILSGIHHRQQFELLQSKLSAFPDVPLRTGHFELAADFNNQWRKHGVQGSHTDFLICAVAHLERLGVFTMDRDFTHYSKYIPLTLHHSRQPPSGK
jgi:predicted nucleic acid-binding protein